MIAVEVVCDAPGCEEALRHNFDGGLDDVLIDADLGQFTIDTSWMDWPSDWTEQDGKHYCPTHAWMGQGP